LLGPPGRVDAGQPRFEKRAIFADLKVGRQFTVQLRLVCKGELLGVFFQEIVEGVDHRHIGDQVHLDRQLTCLLREHDASEVVAERILLPGDEMLCGIDPQRIGFDRGSRVWRRSQAENMRRKPDQSVETILSTVV